MADPQHRDAGSLLTLSVLLSDSSEYTGGDFVCWSASDAEAAPTLHTPALTRGSGVLFVSEKRHNVREVLSGERRSFVIELWDRPSNAFNRWR